MYKNVCNLLLEFRNITKIDFFHYILEKNIKKEMWSYRMYKDICNFLIGNYKY